MNRYAKWFVVVATLLLSAEAARSGWGMPGFGNGLVAMGMLTTTLYYLDK